MNKKNVEGRGWRGEELYWHGETLLSSQLPLIAIPNWCGEKCVAIFLWN
jgi:hypothetical protein